MIRFLTPFIFVAIGALSFGLHMVKIDAKESREELRQVRAEIDVERKAIQVLSAEWSYLNQPGKLQAMSEKYLGLRTIKAEQVAELEDVRKLSLPTLVQSDGETVVTSSDDGSAPKEATEGLVMQASLEFGGRDSDAQ